MGARDRGAQRCAWRSAQPSRARFVSRTLTRRQKILVVLLLSVPALVSAGKWVPLTGYTLSEVYNTESSKRWLYRCIDDFDAVV